MSGTLSLTIIFLATGVPLFVTIACMAVGDIRNLTDAAATPSE